MKGVENSIWLVVEKLLKLILGVVLSGLIARHLGPDEFGELNYLISLLVIFIALTTVGLNRIVVRESASKASDSKGYLGGIVGSAITIRYIGSIIVFSFVIIATWLTDWDNFFYYVIILISLFFTPIDVLEQILQGKGIFKLSSLARLASFLISSFFRIVCLYLELPIIYFIGLVSLEYLLSAIFIFYLYSLESKHWHKNKTLNLSKVRSLFKESWPEMIAGLGAIMFMKSDMIMLYWLSDSVEAGIYAAASRISESWYFLPMAIVTATFPALVKEKDDGNISAYINLLKYTICLLFYISIAVVIVITCFGDYVIELIYGNEYLLSGKVLLVHTWASVFFSLGIISGSWLVVEKKLKYNLYRNFIGLLVNCGLNLILIPIYGALGAAYAMVAGMLFAYFLFDYLFSPMREIAKIKRDSLSLVLFMEVLKVMSKKFVGKA
ncbi:flippase [Vibrio hyugaensis]|uniref:flippase n=1 Tax=Vibrio hyugaensis TaxID=1534743 RepID=UPI0005EFEB49|nr:flippase [Vibrio hyugaensis]